MEPIDWRRHRWAVLGLFASVVVIQVAQLPAKRLLGEEPYPFLVMPGFPGGGLRAGDSEPQRVVAVVAEHADGTTVTLTMADLFPSGASAHWGDLADNLARVAEDDDPMPAAVVGFLRDAAGEATAATVVVVSPTLAFDGSGSLVLDGLDDAELEVVRRVDLRDEAPAAAADREHWSARSAAAAAASSEGSGTTGRSSAGGDR